MVETILLALLAAKIRKYMLTPLFREWTTYPILIFALVYVFLDYSVSHGDYGLLRYAAVFKLSYMCLFSILVFKHRQYKAGFIASACAAAGGILNSVVMRANDGKMPVFPTLSYWTGYMKADTFEKTARYDSVHILGSSSSRLAFLADRIDLGYAILSIGDVYIHIMAFILVYSVIKHLNRSNLTAANAIT